MSRWKEVKDFFNSYEVGSLITRIEMNSLMRLGGIDSREVYRCYLMRAGYLYDASREEKSKPGWFDNGVYLFMKKIPNNLSLSQVKREAYVNHKTTV